MQGTPVVNARYIVAMQDISVEFPGDPYDLVNSAVAIAELYLPLLGHPSGPDPHTVANASSTPDVTQLRQLLARAAREFDKGKQIAAACSAAADFIPDPTIPNAHLAEFLGSGSNLDGMILRHQQAHEASRFNLQRLQLFKEVIAPDDYRRLEIIAVDGVHIPTKADFKPAPPNPKPRLLTERLGNTHLKHFLQAMARGDCIALEPDFIRDIITRCAYMDLNWVDKRDEFGNPVDKGRVCIDPTNVEGGDPINSPEMNLIWHEMYGTIPYTDVTDFVSTMLMHAEENHFPLHEGRIWKDDVSNAFGQMKFDIPSVKKSAIVLRVPEPARVAAQAIGKPMPFVLHLFMLYCYFGWGGASYAFGVFTRALDSIINQVIDGILKIYVDDLQGFAHQSVAAADQAKAQERLRAFFGPNAVAPKSITPCKEADILGWRINLTRESIRPSDRGCRKLLWAFFLVPVQSAPGSQLKWTLPLCQ